MVLYHSGTCHRWHKKLSLIAVKCLYKFQLDNCSNVKTEGRWEKKQSEFYLSLFKALTLSWDRNACTSCHKGVWAVWIRTSGTHTEPWRSPNQQVYLCTALMTHSAVGFSWMRSFMYVSPSRHLSSGKTDYFSHPKINYIHTETCKTRRTYVASDLIKGEIFLFHYQRPERTKSEVVSDSPRKYVRQACVCYLSWLRKRVNTSEACRSSVSSTAIDTLRNCGA